MERKDVLKVITQYYDELSKEERQVRERLSIIMSERLKIFALIKELEKV